MTTSVQVSEAEVVVDYVVVAPLLEGVGLRV